MPSSSSSARDFSLSHFTFSISQSTPRFLKCLSARANQSCEDNEENVQSVYLIKAIIDSICLYLSAKLYRQSPGQTSNSKHALKPLMKVGFRFWYRHSAASCRRISRQGVEFHFGFVCGWMTKDAGKSSIICDITVDGGEYLETKSFWRDSKRRWQSKIINANRFITLFIVAFLQLRWRFRFDCCHMWSRRLCFIALGEIFCTLIRTHVKRNCKSSALIADKCLWLQQHVALYRHKNTQRCFSVSLCKYLFPYLIHWNALSPFSFATFLQSHQLNRLVFILSAFFFLLLTLNKKQSMTEALMEKETQNHEHQIFILCRAVRFFRFRFHARLSWRLID